MGGGLVSPKITTLCMCGKKWPWPKTAVCFVCPFTSALHVSSPMPLYTQSSKYLYHETHGYTLIFMPLPVIS